MQKMRQLFFNKKALFEVKGIGMQLNFNIFRKSLTWHTITIKVYKSFGY